MKKKYDIEILFFETSALKDVQVMASAVRLATDLLEK